MSKPLTDGQYQAFLALNRAINFLPLSRLKDILCTHHGARHFDAALQRARHVCSASGKKNYIVYLALMNRFGQRTEAIADIMRVCGELFGTERESKGRVETLASTTQSPLVERCDPAVSCNTVIEATESVTDSESIIVESENKGRVETLDSITPQPLVEQGDPTASCNAVIEAAESVVENAPQSMSDYLEAFNCNTTRSCCQEFREYGIGYYSDEDCEKDEWCSDQDDRFTVSTAVGGDAMQHGDKPVFQDISEEESVLEA